MKATEAKLLEFVRKSPQLVVPIYQRTYSWTELECRQLFNDIIRAGLSDKISAHFIGSMVYIEKGIYQVSNHSPLLVIDGQQRLTSFALIVLVLIKAIELLPPDMQEPIEGFTTRKLKHYYLVNPDEVGGRYYKLQLSETDHDTLRSIIDGKNFPENYSSRVQENYELFENLIIKEKADLSVVCKGIAKLLVVDVALDRDNDNPQLIFESMNSTGKELTQADLIRNYILMGLEVELQTNLYKNYWQPMERDFGQKAYSTDFDGFMRHYLTIKTDKIPRIGDVYESFKSYSRLQEIAEHGIENLVSDIKTFSKYYCAIAFGKESDLQLKKAFHDIRELRVDVSYPLLLELYHDYENQILSKEDFVQSIRLIESYVFRRAVCSIPTNSMNKTFATFSRNLKKDRYLESIKAQFLLLPSYRRFPNDEEFKREFEKRDLYNGFRRSYWLRRIENFNRKEYVPVNEYTIEHIMPQNPNLSSKWIEDLGKEWKHVQETYLHTIGNLTLTAYNSEYSDRPFLEKRDMEGGFKDSPLKLNAGLASVGIWNDVAILDRASRLSNLAASVWIVPNIDLETLAEYKPTPEVRNKNYTIKNHAYLDKGGAYFSQTSYELFNALREKVLALDGVVTEEFLKQYIAYKAETNFVDIVPLAKRLRLSLNMPFEVIQDPKNICKDVRGLGRWGNGDVEVNFSDIQDLPYIVGLIRQSFELQLTDE